MYEIETVTPLSNYRLLLKFKGTEDARVWDASFLLDKPVFRPLKNVAVFNTVRLVNGIVTWFEDLDLDTDNLYYQSEVYHG